MSNHNFLLILQYIYLKNLKQKNLYNLLYILYFFIPDSASVTCVFIVILFVSVVRVLFVAVVSIIGAVVPSVLLIYNANLLPLAFVVVSPPVFVGLVYIDVAVGGLHDLFLH